MLAHNSSSEGQAAVYVVEPAETSASLLTLLRQLSFTGLTGTHDFADALQPAPVAAIVSDEIANPLEICAALPAGIPKILITADGSFEHRLAAARAGVTAVILRPLQPGELHDWLKLFVAEQAIVAASILIVDDDPLLSELHAEMLRSGGMEVRTINNPVDAIGAIEKVRPDLILMDLQMPGVDGIELARMIRQTRQHVAVPIVFLSGETDMDRQMEARRFGGDIFIKKPVDPNHLISLVRLRADRARTMRLMIERDSLTGLYNHQQFKERLVQEFERSWRTKSDLCFAMVDIDHFKSVNDNYGHPVGDKVIRGLANVLLSRLRRTDIVGRYGGEEFGVLLLDTTTEAAAAVLDIIRQFLSGVEFEAAGAPFKVTFSAGLAGALDSTTPEDLIAAADQALYVAKRGGRNRVCLAETHTSQ